MGNMLRQMGAWLLNPGPPTLDTPVQLAGNVATIIQGVVSAFLGLFTLLGVLFMIYIGFRLAKAEDESKRKEAKKQMIYTIVAIIGVVVLIVLFNTVIMAEIRRLDE